MKIDYPNPSQIGLLQSLWLEAFGDEDGFAEHFFTYGFSPDRCRCVTADDRVVAALYWFDCQFQGRPLAYLYGIATAKACRGQGLCRALLENTHAHLKYLGYAGEILVPAGGNLFRMYEKLGYETCASMSEMDCAAGFEPVQLQPVDATEYGTLRRQYLPENGVVQEGDNLQFLQTMADFYAGADFLVAVARTEEFFATELLGNTQAAPGILAALRKNSGKFRIPGSDKPFAMYYPLSDNPAPGYFGLAFD